MKPFLLRHLKGEESGRFPVWMMRQAGRYLPEYQELRKGHSFWEMVTNPSLAAQVSLMPLDYFPMDGVILFSDILSLPYGLGIPIEMKESLGPVNLRPFRTEEDFAIFQDYSFDSHTRFVGEALRAISEKLLSEKALLGFAGAPWTVACYLVEELPGKRRFESIKHWMYRDPESLARALAQMGEATGKYLGKQVEWGAHLVQVFDTWLSEMPRDFFVKYYRPVLYKLFSELKEKEIPSIYYSKQAYHLWKDFSGLPLDVLSIDSLVSLSQAEEWTGAAFSLQGNLDPLLLFEKENRVRSHTRELVKQARQLKKPSILNLGHGILPDTPVDNVKAFVEEARVSWT